jgi:GNAT superfamily N-acetyltransferase
MMIYRGEMDRCRISESTTGVDTAANIEERPGVGGLVQYHSDLSLISASDLTGFFAGWANSPSPETHLRLLQASTNFVVAVEPGQSQVVGYITALSDGVLSAYISHLEVLPAHRRCGIGSALVRGVLEALDDIYMVDLICDDDVRPFYEALGLQRWGGMIRRNHRTQAGLPPHAA